MREFFSSVSACQVVSTYGPKEGVTNKAEGFVASRVTEGVVIALEIVEIEHHDGERALPAASAVDLAFKKFLHIATVVEAGEGVVDGLKAESLA